MDHGQSHSRPFKRKIAAIVTDQDGQLCHAASLARGYDLPYVVGTQEVTERIRNKTLLRVDGTNSTIHKIR